MTTSSDKNLNGLMNSLFIVVATLFFVNTCTIAKELPDFTELVEKHGPAVVNVSTKTRAGNQHGQQVVHLFSLVIELGLPEQFHVFNIARIENFFAALPCSSFNVAAISEPVRRLPTLRKQPCTQTSNAAKQK